MQIKTKISVHTFQNASNNFKKKIKPNAGKSGQSGSLIIIRSLIPYYIIFLIFDG